MPGSFPALGLVQSKEKKGWSSEAVRPQLWLIPQKNESDLGRLSKSFL